MINSIAVKEQELVLEAPVIFDDNQVITRSSSNPFRGWLDYKQPKGIFVLNKPGIYRVHYNANLTSLAVGAAKLELLVNEKPLEGSVSEYDVVTAGTFGSVSATALVRVAPYSVVPVSLVNASDLKLMVKDASIVIDKVA